MLDLLRSSTKAALLAAFVVSAQVASAGSLADEGYTGGSRLGELFQNIVLFISSTFVPFILAIAFLVFVWNLFRYFFLESTDQEGRAKAKSVMVYAVAGFVFVLIFWGIVNLVASSTGLEAGVLENVPTPLVGD